MKHHPKSTAPALLLPGAMLLLYLLLAGTALAGNEAIPKGKGSYADLQQLFDEFLEFRAADRGLMQIISWDVQGRAIAPVSDYSPASIEAQKNRMQQFQARIADMNVAAWERSQQVDYLAVRSRLDQFDFILHLGRPWNRDPGLYVDQMLRVTFFELPLEGDRLEEFQGRIRAIPVWVQQAQLHLSDVAADYADLAIYALSHPDGVGHGHPFRSSPPAGVLGWYADLEQRASQQQPELLADIQAAHAAVRQFDAWLKEKRPSWTAQAGSGEAAFDWYLKSVKLMPWTSAELVVLGERELDRLWANYALERNRNRDLPELQPASSAEDYAARIADTDRRIRQFLEDEDFITIPADVGELDTNVPWMVRPGGRNFWEEVQFRNPSPDHLHAVIPGHRFDAVMAERNTHPIRSRISSGARGEGWATYLEEAALNSGLFDDQPRVRELIQIFGIFRAARVPADVWLQTRQMNVQQVLDYWLERVPYLDINVARVDAEIYLRRPPGYGIGYTVGALQMQRLLADRKRQLGDDFNLRQFHDDFIAAGRLPLSLIRWEMTGLDDEVSEFWQRQPMPRP